jgi:hypothetical protein
MMNLIHLDLLIITMERNIKGIFKKGRDMEKVCILGEMVHIMKDFIEMISNMVKVNIKKVNVIGKESGMMVREKD